MSAASGGEVTESLTRSLMATGLLLDFGPDVLLTDGRFYWDFFFFLKVKVTKPARALQRGTIKAYLIRPSRSTKQGKVLHRKAALAISE